MNPSPSALVQWFSLLNRVGASVSGLAILLMMVAGGADVVFTNLDKIGLKSRPIPGVFELIATLMVVAVFLAVPLAQQRRGHIQVDLLTRLMPALGQRVAGFLHHALSLAMFGAIAWFGWRTTAHAYGVGEFAAGAFDLPLWPARAALALGASLMALQCLLDLAAEVHPALRGPQVPPLQALH